MDALLPAVGRDLAVLRRAQLVALDHLLKRAEVPFRVAVGGVAPVFGARDQRLRRPRLELDGVRAAARGLTDHLAAERHVAVMIRADLGNDVGGVSRPGQAAREV